MVIISTDTTECLCHSKVMHEESTFSAIVGEDMAEENPTRKPCHPGDLPSKQQRNFTSIFKLNDI